MDLSTDALSLLTAGVAFFERFNAIAIPPTYFNRSVGDDAFKKLGLAYHAPGDSFQPVNIRLADQRFVWQKTSPVLRV